MKENYYEFIKENQIQDSLSWVEDLSYSAKLTIIQEIFNAYGIEILNIALVQYEERYIKTHRIVSYLVRNILVNICKVEKIKRESK